MKRQRGENNVNPTQVEDVDANAIGKKKGKKEVEEKEVKEKSFECKREMEHGVGDNNNNGSNNVMVWNWEEYMPWLGGVVDEQMSWGSTWFPWWDMDFNADVFSSLYSDDVWDDDIWNLNKEIPFTLDRKM